jgi:hypothetical protein
MKYYKGKFSPKNPKKYSGDPTNIIYRSSWEHKLMRYLDENTNVIEWGSEEIIIPYVSPLDNKYHRYFPDIVAKIRLPNNSIKTLILEVKPAGQTQEPKIPTRKTKKFITEVTTWAVNQAKFSAARAYAEERGWEFRLITEKELGIK